MYDKYLLKSGEDLKVIAQKFNTSIEVLKELNNLENVNYLRAGMEIVVPKNKEQYFEYYTIEKGDTVFMGNNEYLKNKNYEKCYYNYRW